MIEEKRPFGVSMLHKMRAYYEVMASSEEEAQQLAYAQSFEELDWEEQDTIYTVERL